MKKTTARPTPGTASPLHSAPARGTHDESQLRQLFDDYLRMYSSRDDRLTSCFSKNFTGFTGGGNFLVKDTEQWITITRQDFTQIKDPIRIELKDVAIQSLADTIAVATGFFTIHLPIKDYVLSRETARLVLIFRKEPGGWKISHSSISIPYNLVGEGEVYPLKELTAHTESLENLVAERTAQLSAANESLRQANEKLVREIAEREQTEAALQRSEQLYRSILMASPDDITITDAQGRILMVSPTAFTMFGFAPETPYQGRSILEFIVPEDRERALAQMALKHKSVVTGANEYRGRRFDGSTFDIEVNSEFIRDAKGASTGMVIIVRDISDRKRKESERQKLEAQNRQLQKAESLSRMAGAMAHHFNNKLQAVIMSLQLTLDDTPSNSSQLENLTIALQSARKAAELSALMRTYLGETIFKREILDLSDVCQQCLPLLRIVMPPDIDLKTDLPLPGPTIQADASQVQHVLTNLLTNAWEASDGGNGGIHLTVRTVSAANIPAQRRFPFDCQLHDTDYACLEIADSGSGINDQDLERLFDPFFSRKFPGRGMGLAVVLGIARAHQWVITVESTPGQGSVFRIFLPISTEGVFGPPTHPAHGKSISR